MVYKLARHKIQIYLIILTFAITLISGYDYWKMWSVAPITLTIFYMIDIMFLNEKDYLYEPNYANWKDVTEPDY